MFTYQYIRLIAFIGLLQQSFPKKKPALKNSAGVMKTKLNVQLQF
jgi:hypothetical protein